jgi:hypothetical protein
MATLAMSIKDADCLTAGSTSTVSATAASVKHYETSSSSPSMFQSGANGRINSMMDQQQVRTLFLLKADV